MQFVLFDANMTSIIKRIIYLRAILDVRLRIYSIKHEYQ